MKKFILIVLVFLLAGCTAVRMDDRNIDVIVNVILSKENNLYNRIGKGYKYYLPRGVTYIDTIDYNEKLYSKGNYYFLFVDIVSYHNRIILDYQINEDAYFSKAIDINGNLGYLEINRINGLFFIEFMYNYAKIEAIVSENDINEVILDASYILSTIKFNDRVINLLLQDDYFDSREEVYDVFKPKKETGNFLRVEDQ